MFHSWILTQTLQLFCCAGVWIMIVKWPVFKLLLLPKTRVNVRHLITVIIMSVNHNTVSCGSVWTSIRRSVNIICGKGSLFMVIIISLTSGTCHSCTNLNTLHYSAHITQNKECKTCIWATSASPLKVQFCTCFNVLYVNIMTCDSINRMYFQVAP